ncbi:pyridoxamine 5'-phosphate oxidase family protein [Tabrizicola sp. J26]|uniref:HugZ family pyridoxamine 5'-phosphate oxidase n=1 Tax=Alitabrizicola rongguiensis TaxID=2909234 RepID=UPI001F423015|nr:pyridoxamine 5'-phosphate oxidase family protein [Tabrizicola rongguiensis]MCF1707337.1 pyridoxamine 5'-phosphate oxidase family protein [Tabrizicola rongguiensis]
MPDRNDPFLPPDDEGRALARRLLAEARHAALAYADPAAGTPMISRIAFGLGCDGTPVTLISTLSAHDAGLRAQPLASVMVGEPGAKGDPLTHPRLMVQVRAEPLDRAAPDLSAIRERWLADHPKSRLYIDFADFGFFRLTPIAALLNGGFGRAMKLAPADLRP